jgi:hypothetical protein
MLYSTDVSQNEFAFQVIAKNVQCRIIQSDSHLESVMSYPVLSGWSGSQARTEREQVTGLRGGCGIDVDRVVVEPSVVLYAGVKRM